MSLIHGLPRLLLLFPLADVISAFQGLTKLLSGYLPAIFSCVVVIAGYIYMASLDDTQKAVQAKRAIAAAVIGAIIVLTAAQWGASAVNFLK